MSIPKKNTPTAQVADGVKSEKLAAPVVEQTTPVVEESAPVVEEKAPEAEQTTSIVEESAPVVEETSTEEKAPEAEQTTSIVGETSTEEKAPEAEQTTGITVNDAEIVVPEIFEYNGKNYTLAKYVKKLQVNGRVYSREEILTNKEIMANLIVGNSPFVKRQ